MKYFMYLIVSLIVTSCSDRPKDLYVEQIMTYPSLDFFVCLKVKYHDKLYNGVVSTSDFMDLMPTYVKYSPSLLRKKIFDYKHGLKTMKFSQKEFEDYDDQLIAFNSKIIDTLSIFKNYCSKFHFNSTSYVINEEIPKYLKNQILYSLIINDYSCLIDCETGVTLVSKIIQENNAKE